MKIYLTTLGCKLNESEVEAWARRFAREGSEIVNDARAADLIVLNTCTVTHIAARKTRQLARQLARANPRARIVLTGCFVSISPDEAKALPNVALVVPNAEKDQLVEQIANCELRMANGEWREPSVVSRQSSVASQSWLDADAETQVAGRQPELKDGDRGQKHENFHPSSFILHPSLRTRAFVKIQDGCNLSCAYCIIPLARGQERSRPRVEIIDEVNALVGAGYKEIILTGVQISAYRQKPGFSEKPGFLGLRDLVAAILAETSVPRLRLTSIAPWNVDEGLLDLWCDARLCRHLHLSLQSGCDATLRRMQRPYTTAQFARAVEMARAQIPDVGITTDVIVGFPGESDAEFEQSLKFVEQMQFSRAHIFPYSKRDGTRAASLPMQVADAVKQARAKQMQVVADASLRAFAARFVGRKLMVLWETEEKAEGGRMKDEKNRPAQSRKIHPSSFIPHPSMWSGYSDNYIRVVASSDADLYNQFTSAYVTAVTDDGVIATA
ncbi:MAG: tRNA (N(6)-L-threonylcarbamoyladenosine(37)-C(2))-methylthiotransferase MtaB [Anaerolineales bacterium]|nr:tRNA (N(6)-L-threonylcarbamoyladenosine(37)-C(2))-methylthiotransferase MtaB [Anaerolineales bacterium]